MRQVALSYAVGEWARVWPLDVLFRSFGSYFVRRGEKDPLYHRVLERYLQLVASRGLTTAFFLEGGLSRDGRLREPKIGLLDYLIGMLRSEPEREIVFIPVGINYDRVLEDRNLTGAEAAPGVAAKLRSAVSILLRLPVLLGAFFTRAALRAHRKYGYAAISFGRPVRLRSLDADPASIARMPRAERLPRIAELADALQDHVAHAIPATPVPLLAGALLGGARETADLRRAVKERIAELRAAGRPFGFGLAFQSVRTARAEPTRTDEPADKVDLDEAVTDGEEAERVVDLATTLLLRRRLLRREGARFVPTAGAEPLLAYYARSLDPPTHRASRPPFPATPP